MYGSYDTPEKAKRDNEKLRGKIATQMREKYDRMLPLDEMLLDRWKKAEFLGFGEQTNVYDNVYIYGSRKLEKTFGSDFSSFGWNRRAYNRRRLRHQLRGHDFYSLQHCDVFQKETWRLQKPVEIGNYVYVGSVAIVLPGSGNRRQQRNRCGSRGFKECARLKRGYGGSGKIVGKVVLKGKKAKIEFNNNLDGE